MTDEPNRADDVLAREKASMDEMGLEIEARKKAEAKTEKEKAAEAIRELLAVRLP